MTILNEVYKCAVCGNIVEVVHAGGGQLVCCGSPMILQKENTVDASLEKHIPVINAKGNGIEVVIGSVLHPSEDAHYIEWIELSVDGVLHKRYIAPGQIPSAYFEAKGEKLSARAYCNLHGLWKKE